MMSRRKQTKPFKVQDEVVEDNDRKKRLRRFHTESSSMEVSSSQSDVHSDEEAEDNVPMMPDSVARRSKRHVSKCNQCGKVLASALSLARHRLTHSQNKPHQCPKCNAGFKTSSNMHRHLRIHFREETEPETKNFVISKTPTVRSPRQNIRTPNKFKEFDVDLVGIRSSSTKKSSEEQTKKKVKTPIVIEKDENLAPSGKEISKTEDDKNSSILNIIVSDKTPIATETTRLYSKGDDPDLMCHVCNKTFISKFGLLTHSISHPDMSTRCHLCDQSFITHKGLVMHNIIVHKIMETKQDVKKNSSNNAVVIKGFQDLVPVDFSSTKFPQIAEAICTQVRHKHPERDSQHIFICKKCDKAFPQLCSLKLHVQNVHGAQIEIETRKDDTLNFFSLLNLSAVLDKSATDDRSLEDNQKINLIKNGLDDDLVYASDSVASNSVPQWMKNSPDLDGSGYKTEIETPSKRPRLMLKIVRKKSSIDPSPLKFKPVITGNQMQAGNYFIDENGLHEKRNETATRKLRNFAVKLSSSSSQIIKHNNSRQESASKGNESSTERNVFWCRICNYSSHEKSALVRHLLTHSGIRPYFCKLCNYAFTTKANCERHVRKRHHCLTKDEIESAVRCDMEMLRKAPKNDIYIISGSNSSCPVCGKSFSYNHELKEHLKIHEERQFVCQLCNVRCTTRNNCVRHILYKHPGIRHQEANNIISFVGTQSRGNTLRKIAPKSSAIDISRGSIVPRDPVPSNLRKNKRLSGSSAVERQISNTLHARNFKLTGEAEITDDADVAGAESSSFADNSDNIAHSDAGATPKGTKILSSPKKMIGLLPLMKIKAYNEANTKFYLKMVELYEKVNFFNRTLRSEVMEEDGQNNELNTENAKAVFACRSCSSMFETKEELAYHAESCSAEDTDFNSFLFNNNTEENSAQKDDWNENHASFPIQTSNTNYVMNEGIDWSSGQKSIRDSNPDGNAESTQIRTTESEKSHVNENGILNLSKDGNGSRRGFTNRFQNVDDWEENVVPCSPSSNKSSDTPTQSDSTFPLVSDVSSSMYMFSNKESSYVEDSLLMNLCDDIVDSNYKKVKPKKQDGSNETGSLPDSFLSVQGFSSSLPTMVNMDSPTMTRIRSQVAPQSTSDREAEINREKVLVPSKGRFYTARKCPQCDKSFPWASSLRRHIMTHTGLKLYMCRLCKMRFTTRSNLIRHVYRRHGMAKQHPDFASCLAKLHPSDTLLKEVEENVRRKIDMQKKKGGVLANENDDEAELGNETDDEDYMEESPSLTKKTGGNDFQSMLEQDPETLLMDLDYSPRDYATLSNVIENVKSKVDSQISPEHQAQQDSNANDSEEQEDSLVIVESEENSSTAAVRDEEETSLDDSNLEDDGVPLLNRGYNDRESRFSEKETQNSSRSHVKKKKPLYKTVLKPKIRNKQSTQFVCGLCKKIFKSVPELREHLDTHDVPHSWHCPICSVPFTNKYNCQRHLTRRHQCTDIEPMYVEDSKHGPRTARGHPRKMPISPMEGIGGH